LLGRGGALTGGILGLGAAGLVGFELPHETAVSSAVRRTTATPDAAGPGGLVHNFVTRPDLVPPAINVTRTAAGVTPAGPDYIFLSSKGYPTSGPGQAGNIILDRDGQIVWFAKAGTPSWLDFNTQMYRGHPVLTWWEGEVTGGHGAGEGLIADSSYKIIARVKAGRGLMADLHEFVITPQDSALVTAYRAAPADLSALGGPAKGFVLAGLVQEIDIATGKVLFEWDSLDHVDPADSTAPFGGGTSKQPFDYFHINSIAVMPDGDLLISARNTSAVYKISRPAGKVAWQLSGKKPSFTMGTGTRFHFQHHARPHGDTVISLFDDGGAPPQVEKQSRAILLDLDTRKMTATLRQQYVHPAGVAAANQGSMQVLGDGRVFVGWGNEPYFSEFAADGTLRLDGEFPVGDQSYRAFTANWSGQPDDPPSVAARKNPAGGSVVYASWNGATKVASWTVHAGQTAAALRVAGHQERRGFETAIAVAADGPYFSVTPRDASGSALASSATVKVKDA
jgi:hypothetical protein